MSELEIYQFQQLVERVAQLEEELEKNKICDSAICFLFIALNVCIIISLIFYWVKLSKNDR